MVDAKFPLIAKTLFGLEAVLADELAALGAEEIAPGRRLVAFQADQRLMYRANIWLRTAIRVLKPIHVFAAEDERSLYAGVQQVDWSQHLAPDGSLTIDPVVYSSFCTHSLYAAQLAKDAIVDQFRAHTGERPSVDRDDPDLRINLHLNQNRATIYLDSSGASLHKRGYRAAASQAPLGEVLAAGIVRLSQWDQASPLVDFMCGAGTVLIEAAMLARNIAPGLVRREFGYMWWPDFNASLHEELLAEARLARRSEPLPPIVGSDLDPAIIEIAKQNARLAGVDRDIEFRVEPFDQATPPGASGTLITNPPYDERMRMSQVSAVYRRIGDALKRNWPGWSAWILTGALDAESHVGLKPAKRITLFNGPIECQLLKYKMFGKAGAQPAVIEASPDAADVSASPAEPSPAEPTRPLAGSLPGRRWEDQAAEFANRLRRMAKHWAKWARRQEITCYRIYDRDIPEIPVGIDWYEGYLQIAEYDRPHERTDVEHQIWLQRMIETAAGALGVDLKRVFLKRRERQVRGAQYERQSDAGVTVQVREGGRRFQVNLSDYLDTGLFLDHRQTRAMVQSEAAGKRFLNLFGYTGAFTVYAAAGGAASTTTVDLSNTYLEWAQTNLRLNGFKPSRNQFVRDDALSFLTYYPKRREPPFDLAVIDPPTVSRSKKTEDDWDVQRDHARLLNLALSHMSPGGKIYFSTNFRRFKLHADEIQGATIREITKQTIPPDFRNKRIHQCWTLVKQ